MTKDILLYKAIIIDNELKIFSPETIEEKTSFEIKMSNNDQTLLASFNLWETEDKNIRPLCKVTGSNLRGEYTLYNSSFDYGNYNIIITSQCEKIKLAKPNLPNFTFLY